MPVGGKLSNRGRGTTSLSKCAEGDPNREPYLEMRSGSVVSNPLEWTNGAHLGIAVLVKGGRLRPEPLKNEFVATIQVAEDAIWCGRPAQYWRDDAGKMPKW